jgi:hypothetical protein
MRLLGAALVSLVLLGSLALTGCGCCGGRDDTNFCEVPKDLAGMTHAQAIPALAAAGFTRHPRCRDSQYRSCHSFVGICPDDWIVKDPPRGFWTCNSVLDLCFVAPKTNMASATESAPASRPTSQPTPR